MTEILKYMKSEIEAILKKETRGARVGKPS